MKLHLPLSLLRSLLTKHKGFSRTLIILGALLALPAHHTTIATFASDCMERAQELWKAQAQEGKKNRTVTANSLSGNTGARFNDFSAEQNLSCRFLPLTLANVAEENVLGMQRTGGGGAMLVPHPSLPSGDSKNTVSTQLLITAGIAPLENVVAHGNASSTNTQVAAPQVAAAAAPPATPPTTSTALSSSTQRSTSSSANSPALIAELPTTQQYIWKGTATSNGWDAYATNWQYNGSTTTFTSGGSVTFDNTASGKDINIGSAQTVEDMTVIGSDYYFGGGGNITINDQLYIAATGDTTFAGANNISANRITLESSSGTVTTFNGSVTTGTLTMSNSNSGEDAGLHAGDYVFNGSLTITGAANIDLGTEGDQQEHHFEANGAVQVGSLSLAGASQKDFMSSVRTSGDFTISGSQTNGSTADEYDGSANFIGTVTIDGDFILKDNGTANFGNQSSLTVSGDIYMGDAQLVFNKFAIENAADDFGRIHLTADGAEISLSALSRGEAIIGNPDGNAYDFTFGGAARSFAATLQNISDLYVNGGSITILDSGDYSSTGQIKGALTVSNAVLTLQSAEIFDSTVSTSGNISVVSGTLDLGTTTQHFNGNLHLQEGIIKGDAGSKFVSVNNSSISFSGQGNAIIGTMELGSYDFTASANSSGNGERAALSITGDMTGTGHLHFTGAGTTTIESALSYEGEVFIQGGASLDLKHENSLQAAKKITVGSDNSTLTVTHGGVSTVMNGEGVWDVQVTVDENGNDVGMQIGLEFESGAVLNFCDLNGHENTAAIQLTQGLLFNGNITFNFIESSGEELTNLKTYELITSETGINHRIGSSGGVTVYANGKTTPLDSSQYAFGFYIDDQNLRHFTFSMLAGKSWVGGSGDWHEMQEGSTTEYKNWSAGIVGQAALLRTQTDYTDVVISLGQATMAKGMYMDGSTNYTIAATDNMAGVDAFGAAEDPLLIKKGSGTMTWSRLTGTHGDVEISQGTLALTNNSTLSSSGTITITDIAYAVPADGSNAVKDDSATLSIDSSSMLKLGEAKLTAYSNTSPAELHGVTISGITETSGTSGSSTAAVATISGYSSGLSGTTEVPSTHTVANADISNFAVNNVTFTGQGSMKSMTINENVVIASGADYYLGEDMAILTAITNNGTVRVDSNSLIGVGRQDSAVVSNDGFTTTYTPFIGSGRVEGWTLASNGGELSAANFRVRGTTLSNIKDITVTLPSQGQVQVSSSTVKFIRWDSEFNPVSWDTPTVGLHYSSTSSDFTIANNSNTYRYDQRLNSGGDTSWYVVNLDADAGGSNRTLVGSGTDTANIWINDEGSNFSTYIAGRNGSTSGTTTTFTGDTRLQIQNTLQNASRIVGGSQNARQTGDSYLTFEAGNFSNDTVVAGSYATSTNYASRAIHYGDSSLHILDGTFTSVYGGSYNTYTSGGDTRVVVDGGTITNIFGGDFYTSSSNNTHTGNVVVDLRGGTVTNVYGAGGGSGNSTNRNEVSGDVTINLYAGEDGNMLTSFANNAMLQGGNSQVSGSSTLHVVNAGSYNLENVTISGFDNIQLEEGVNVSTTISKLNDDSTLTVTGPGTFTLTGDGATNKPSDLTITGGATLKLQITRYNTMDDRVSTLAALRIDNGSTLDVTGYPLNANSCYAMDLYIAGDGKDGKGAIYKADTQVMGDVDSQVSLYRITLTDHASVGNGWGSEGGHSEIHMISTQYTAKAGQLDLLNGTSLSASNRGYIFSKQGDDIFGLWNVDVRGGTINLAGGTLLVSHSSDARNSDLVLHKGTLLSFSADAGYKPNPDGDPDNDRALGEASNNGFLIESLSGEGSVELGSMGNLEIAMDQGYTDFTADFQDETRLFHNDKAYTYAVYSGLISGSGLVTKSGNGTQTFTNSDSTYSGGTVVQGGRLYLTGTSTAETFAQATRDAAGVVTDTTTVKSGIIGTGALQWQGGEVYLADGVTIYNHSLAAGNTSDIIIGVEGGNGSYSEATYSGMIATNGAMRKVDGGTLNFNQLGRFSQGITIEGGTLNLYGWADLDPYTITNSDGTTTTIANTLTQYAGTSLMFSYDGSYGNNATDNISANLTATGTGDERWLTDEQARTDHQTAAIISDIGSSKKLLLSGTISAGSEDGNLLHSGEGELTLTGANSYTGGTTVMRGTVVAANATASADSTVEANNTALGATAEGGSANLVQAEAATIRFMEAETITTNTTTLAATATDANGNATGDTGNDIRGAVFIGTEDEKTAQLIMKGDGYNASRTELGLNDVLIFDGRSSSNWDGQMNAENNAALTLGDLGGAGILAGDVGSKVVVTDNVTAYGDALRTMVYFQVTDALTGTISEEAALNADDAQTDIGGYKGDLIVEGEQALLHIQGGAITGGNYEVSGTGARLDAAHSIIVVESGKHISLTSRGDEDADHDSTATLAAYRVEVKSGGTLSAATASTTYNYTNAREQVDLIALPLEAAIKAYPYNGNWDRAYYGAQNINLEKHEYYWHFDERIALNTRTAATLETSGGLTLLGGSIYESRDSSVSLGNTKLTMDVSSGGKIVLKGTGTYYDENNVAQTLNFSNSDASNPGYVQRLTSAEDDDPTRQWVLFTDVSAFELINGTNSISGLSLSLDPDNDPNQPYNRLYYAYAADVFTTEDSSLIPEDVLLVYDAGAQVVYLDRIPNEFPDPVEEVPFTPPSAIPEPTTATLSLLALTALAARRRRK